MNKQDRNKWNQRYAEDNYQKNNPVTLVGDWLPRLLHAGIMARREQRKKLEILCRYICRPALSEKPLAISHSGRIRYKL